MIISENFIFVELHKTGSSHTRKILLDLFGDSCEILKKHASLESVSYDISGGLDNKIKIGNIRNPWDWYVSLWAFGCQKKGGIYNYVTSTYKVKTLSRKGLKKLIRNSLNLELSKIDRSKWELLYSDVNNIDNFNKWIKLILEKRNHDIGEGFKASNISKFAGLLTYRYFNLFMVNKDFKKLKSIDELKSYDLTKNTMDVILRNEVLHENLMEIAGKIGVTQKEMKTTLQKHSNRTNISVRQKDYRNYYSDEANSLIEKYEKFIIDKYQYSF